jgi:hypothetical protein
LAGVLSVLQPQISIEVGTSTGGSLRVIGAHSTTVHSFDLVRHEDLTAERFPNVTFHTGDSHELLPQLLEQLARDGTNVDFAFVDGDHTAAGVKRDVEDLLASGATARTVILVHDTLNERVRAGLDATHFDAFADVRVVDLDFVPGRALPDGQLWAGLGVIVKGWDVTAEVLARGVRDGSGSALWAVEQELATERELVTAMQHSFSWRLTAPLRALRKVIRRGAKV